jgi:hypothetical protein
VKTKERVKRVKPRRVLLTALGLVWLAFPASSLAAGAPSIASSFTPSSIPSGGTSTLSFTITNNDSGQGVTGVGFTDNLPAGVTVASPSGATGSCGGGTFTASAGASTITLSEGAIAASGNCTVSASVTSSTPGTVQNSTGTVSSVEDGPGNSDTKSLSVVAAPAVTSFFTPNPIGTGDTTSLSVVIINPGTVSSLSSVGFTDNLPSGLVIDNPNGTSVGKGCTTNAVLTATSGSTQVSLTGATISKSRVDSAAAVTSGSGAVTDSAITTSDVGRLVTGPGIPPLTYVGSVTAGTSFTLSSSPSVGLGDVTATAGGTGVTISPDCVVAAAVTTNTAGVYQNSTGTVSSTEGGASAGDTESLTVIDPPSVTITTPAQGAVYQYGQKVMASYSCQEAENGPGLAACSGDVPNGSAINTKRAGVQTFTVDAFSNDGEFTEKDVTYRVLPNNQFTVSNLNAQSSGRVTFDAKVPGPGRIAETETAVIKGQSAKPVAFGANGLTVTRGGAYGILVALTTQGRQLVAQVHAANHSSRPKHEVILVTLKVTYTPRGGRGSVQTFRNIAITP